MTTAHGAFSSITQYGMTFGCDVDLTKLCQCILVQRRASCMYVCMASDMPGPDDQVNPSQPQRVAAVNHAGSRTGHSPAFAPVAVLSCAIISGGHFVGCYLSSQLKSQLTPLASHSKLTPRHRAACYRRGVVTSCCSSALIGAIAAFHNQKLSQHDGMRRQS